MTDGDTFNLMGLTGEDVNGYPGLAGTITVLDVPGETFVDNTDLDGVWAQGEPCVVAFHVQLKWSTEFDGEVTVWLKEAKWNGIGMPSPTDNTQRFEITSTGPSTVYMIFTGTAWLDPPEVAENDGSDSLSIHIRQDSGTTQTLTAFGVLVSRVGYTYGGP
jgi:hypothetical protein